MSLNLLNDLSCFCMKWKFDLMRGLIEEGLVAVGRTKIDGHLLRYSIIFFIDCVSNVIYVFSHRIGFFIKVNEARCI